MPEISWLLVVIIFAALAFDYTNGAHDAANAIATVVSTKVLSPRAAVVMSATLNFGGAMLGTRVAETIGKGIVDPKMILDSHCLLLASVLAAIAWNSFTWWLGLPSSSSHALIGGLIGAAVVECGWSVLQYRSILEKVVVPLFVSPLAGLIAGYFLMVLIAWLTHGLRYRTASAAFKRLQILTAGFMSVSHGSNDAQKTMGLITLSLLSYGLIPSLTVPLWVKLACAGAISLGTMTGGWKIIRTMGHKIFRMRPVHGFAAEIAASTVIFSASLFGAPISTTHVISSSVLGVGSAQRWTAVKWRVAGEMVSAWVFTIPCAAVAGALWMMLLGAIGL
ncbi:MAG: inorganic phosphate transporter [Acidobacteriota bacterium]